MMTCNCWYYVSFLLPFACPHRINAVDSPCEGLDRLPGIPTRVPQRVYVAIYIIIHQMYTTHIRGEASPRQHDHGSRKQLHTVA